MVFIKFIFILSLTTWIGSMIFFSFFAAPSIFKVLSKELAGKVVGDIFPKYWMLGYICSITSLGTLLLLEFQQKTFPSVKFSILLVMTLLAFCSGMIIGNKTRDIKADINRTVEGSKKSELKDNFKKYHIISTGLNVLIIILGLVLLFFIVPDFS